MTDREPCLLDDVRWPGVDAAAVAPGACREDGAVATRQGELGGPAVLRPPREDVRRATRAVRFSFLEAAEQPEALVAEAARLDMGVLALVDRDGLYGAPRFYQAATRAGIRPLIGSELTLRDGARLPSSWKTARATRTSRA